MTNEEAKDLLAYDSIWNHKAGEPIQEALRIAIEALEQQSCEKSKPSDGSNELLTADERADVLNAVNDTLEKFGLEICGYEDDGTFFNILTWRR